MGTSSSSQLYTKPTLHQQTATMESVKQTVNSASTAVSESLSGASAGAQKESSKSTAKDGDQGLALAFPPPATPSRRRVTRPLLTQRRRTPSKTCKARSTTSKPCGSLPVTAAT